jgi:hypothetical protein
MQREKQLAAAEYRAKRPEASALADYHRFLKEKADRQRQKQLDMPMHLRTGTNPIDMGCPVKYETNIAECLKLPVSMSVDPKWSTELKRMNDKIGERATYERKLSASVTGSISPEYPYMSKKDYISNPPTPYFLPGRKRTPNLFPSRFFPNKSASAGGN